MAAYSVVAGLTERLAPAYGMIEIALSIDNPLTSQKMRPFSSNKLITALRSAASPPNPLWSGTEHVRVT